MNHTQQDVREFFERQRDKLSKMAKECTDPVDRRRLEDMVGHYTRQLECRRGKEFTGTLISNDRQPRRDPIFRSSVRREHRAS